MKEIIFEIIENLLDLSAFELEYRHRAKSNPFSEKWINCTRSRARIKKVKNYLYSQIKIVLDSDKSQEFYEIALRPFIRQTLEEIQKSIVEFGESKENILYQAVFFKLSLDDLFILFTNLIAWEHQIYPALLEHAIFESSHIREEIVPTDDYLRYYVRFLDVLSSSEIISLFDLDALKNTILSDQDQIDKKPLSSLHLFEDWPMLNLESFSHRFPHFKENLAQKMADSKS
ncbi:hypothetical protein NEF87_004626 [Candidatus Lokiarchaeum ossiferum]|uniref:Uncharacterized protein n=1 Tax=Candidatus Lokiarchaeum ossiferum TaxID=2951803 RepID=A0ABY6HXT5_9ARCH|nr:hypothetical protein NEF87_004626 [Candidatus Lokiarchaeum sp. B-35]